MVIEGWLLVALLSVEDGRVCGPGAMMRFWLEEAGFAPVAVHVARPGDGAIRLYRERDPPHEVWLVVQPPGDPEHWCVVARRRHEPA